MERFDWDKLRVFSKVAEVGSFSRAAEFLHISQSALSRQVKILEKELGCLLFKRVPRGLVLTPAGEILYKTTQGIILRLASTEMMLIENKDAPRGLIRVAVTHVLGTFWLPKQLLIFTERYPDIQFKLIFTEKETNFALKKVDMSISLFPPSTVDAVSLPPVKSETGIYASQSYLKNYGTPQTISELDHHRLMIFQDHATPSSSISHLSWLLEIGRPPGNPRPFSVAFNSLQGLYYATKRGVGVAQLPKFFIRPEDDFVELFQDIKKPKDSRYVVCSKQAISLKRVLVFRHFILHQLQSFFSKGCV